MYGLCITPTNAQRTEPSRIAGKSNRIVCVMVQCPDQCASPVLRSHSIKPCLCDYAVALKQDQHLLRFWCLDLNRQSGQPMGDVAFHLHDRSLEPMIELCPKTLSSTGRTTMQAYCHMESSAACLPWGGFPSCKISCRP